MSDPPPFLEPETPAKPRKAESLFSIECCLFFLIGGVLSFIARYGILVIPVMLLLVPERFAVPPPRWHWLIACGIAWASLYLTRKLASKISNKIYTRITGKRLESNANDERLSRQARIYVFKYLGLVPYTLFTDPLFLLITAARWKAIAAQPISASLINAILFLILCPCLTAATAQWMFTARHRQIQEGKRA